MFNKRKIILFLPVIFALVVVPLAIQQFIFSVGFIGGHDTYAHLSYGKFFTNAFFEGGFPVRWMEWIRPGYGQPLFNFYQVGFYYLLSLINNFHSNYVESFKIAIYLVWIFGIFSTFLFTKKYGLIAASLASVIYAFSPYILLDVFVRASFPEFMALSFFPAILFSVDKIFQRKGPIFSVLFSLFIGITLISHLPSAIIFFPVVFAYILYEVLTEKSESIIILKFLTLFLIGVGLASFYLLPAVFELSLIKIKNLTVGIFDFHNNFANPLNPYSFIWGYTGTDITTSTRLGFVQWGILALSPLILILKTTKKNKLTYIFWVLFIFYILFFSYNGSLFFWEKIKLLQYIQFPWRFYLISPFLIAIISALLLNLFKRNLYKLLGFVLALVLLVIFVFPSIPPKPYINPAFIDFFNTDYKDWKNFQYTNERAFLEPGYDPIGVAKTSDFGIWMFESENKQVNIEILEEKIKTKKAKVKSKESAKLILNTHYFPGWTAYENRVKVSITPTYPKYFMEINIPKGESIAEFRFEDTPIRKYANLISALSATALLMFLIYSWRKKF